MQRYYQGNERPKYGSKEAETKAHWNNCKVWINLGKSSTAVADESDDHGYEHEDYVPANLVDYIAKDWCNNCWHEVNQA